MGASAFIFLALYCLNKDPTAFFSQNLIRNLINYSTEGRKIQQGKATGLFSLLRNGRTEKMPPLLGDMPRSERESKCATLSSISLGLGQLHVSYQAEPNPREPGLSLFDCPPSHLLFSGATLGCGKCQIPIISKYIHFDNTLITNGEGEQVKLKNVHNF